MKELERKNGWIKTEYHYKEDWQYQEIWFNEDLDILRRQNHKGRLGNIIDTEDLFKPENEGYRSLFNSYVLPIIKYKLF